jgi:NodT family efflux transporter outer membrane factor (OMF) lipoprotein
METEAWWLSFNDPILSSLIAQAAASNLDIQQAALRIAEARTQREIAGAAQLPSLSGNSSYARQRFSETTAQGSLFSSIGNVGGASGIALPSYPNPYDQFQVGFDASWEPDLFGGIRRSIEAANANTEASINDKNDALVSLEGEVAHSYIDLRNTQQKRAITQQNLDTQREILALARQRFRSGLGMDVDVSNADAQVTSTQAQLPLLDRQATLDINQLSQLLAREPGALQSELEIVKPVPDVPSEVRIGLPADLLRRRADIQSAEARLHAATARVGVATADLFPHITFDASFGIQAETFPGLVSWASRFFNIGPSLQLPIFDGGKLRATVQLQNVQEKEAAVDYARTVLGAVHEVENALVAYNTEQSRRDSLEGTLIQNRNVLDLARQRYKSGVTTFLDVLDAERTLQQTELSLADSTAAVSTDLVALYKALGGGWKT